ncbi:hypothetical protein BDQ17DRAFT_1451617 [Cyathus striatus]|nr:hypothetical protein BDQ17DRAFT_1451617 [Cyathus striatus]
MDESFVHFDITELAKSTHRAIATLYLWCILASSDRYVAFPGVLEIATQAEQYMAAVELSMQAAEHGFTVAQEAIDMCDILPSVSEEEKLEYLRGMLLLAHQGRHKAMTTMTVFMNVENRISSGSTEIWPVTYRDKRDTVTIHVTVGGRRGGGMETRNLLQLSALPPNNMPARSKADRARIANLNTVRRAQEPALNVPENNIYSDSITEITPEFNTYRPDTSILNETEMNINSCGSDEHKEEKSDNDSSDNESEFDDSDIDDEVEEVMTLETFMETLTLAQKAAEAEQTRRKETKRPRRYYRNSECKKRHKLALKGFPSVTAFFAYKQVEIAQRSVEMEGGEGGVPVRAVSEKPLNEYSITEELTEESIHECEHEPRTHYIQDEAGNSTESPTVLGAAAWQSIEDMLKDLRAGNRPTDPEAETDIDKRLENWKNIPKLRRAKAALTVKCKEKSLDVIFRAHLHGMMGMLNYHESRKHLVRP